MPGLAAAVRHAPRRDSVAPDPEVSPDSKSHHRAGLPLFLQRQAKLIATEPGDEYEQEADRVSGQVMRMSEPEESEPLPLSITAKANSIQTKFAGSPAEDVPAAFENRLDRSKGRGNPLPEHVLLNMATRFGVDFSEVQVHTGDDAEQMNRAVGAEAFTHGSDIYFGPGHSPTNSELTAHELTHVIQQTGGLPQPTGSTVGTPKQAPASRAIAGQEEQKPTRESLGETEPAAEAEKAPAPAVEKGAAKVTAAETSAGKDISPAPPTPETDPAFQEARKQVRVEAKKQKTHDPKNKKRREMEDAAALEPEEQAVQSAEEKRTAELGQVGAKQQEKGQKFDVESFKAAFRKLVDGQKPPKTEDAVKKYQDKKPLEKFPEELSHGIAEKQGEVTGPIEAKSRETLKGGTAVEAKEVPPAKSPAAPAPVDPRLAIAKPVPEEQLSQQHESDRLDGAMEKNRLDDDQLAESREPSFVETLKVKQEAKQKLAEAPGVYREQEATILGSAEAQTQQLLATRLGGMHGISHRTGGHVFKDQKSTESTTEKRQAEIKKTIDGFYDTTVTGVQAVLTEMTTQVKAQFADRLKFQSDEFNRRVRKRVSDYYGDWRIDDKLFGPADVVVNDDGTIRPMTLRETFGGRGDLETINPDVYQIFVQEKEAFIAAMGEELDRVAEIVVNGLNAAQSLIELGKTNIAIFKATLKGDELLYANQLEEEVRLKFENLEGSITEAQQDLLQTMADSYTEQVTQLKKTFTDINDELKKSWIDRAIEFIETVGRTIFQLADLLLTILVRMAHLIWDIIKHPIRFFETLVSGLMQGIGDFIGNIGTHLQEAFWTWITGATAVRNITLSAASGVRALFDLVVQLLSLGPDDLRAIVEKVLGKEFMELVDKGVAFAEKAIEPVTILLTKGPVAFWDYLVDSLESIIQSAFDRIKESVFFAFVEKGLKWIAGFFIPGGGFVKIVKAIVAAFQFVATNLDKIRQFFDAVFDSMEEAVAGNASGVANWILKGLKIGVVLALDFLARQLGLETLVDSVHKILHSIRQPIVRAIEWVLQKVKPFVMKIMRTLGLGKKDQPPEGGAQKGAYDGQIGKVVKFSAAGESHRLWIIQKGPHATVMMATVEKPVSEQLHEYEQMAGALTDPYKQQNAMRYIKLARYKLGQLDKEADTLAGHIVDPKHIPQEVAEEDRAVENDEEQLASYLTKIREALGLVAIEPAAVSSTDLRERADRVLEHKVPDVHSRAEAEKAVAQVAEGLRPLGLKSFEIGPESAERASAIYADHQPLGALLREAREQSEEVPRSASVRTAIQLKLSEAANVPAGMIEATHAGRRPTGGIVLHSDEPTELKLVTWNITALSSANASDHAEDQFVDWFRKQNRKNNIMQKVEEIRLQNFNLSPCDDCCGKLRSLLREIEEAQQANPRLRKAEIYWQELYERSEKFPGHHSATQTTWNGIRALTRGKGWTIHAPNRAFPVDQEKIPADIYSRWTFKRKMTRVMVRPERS